MKNFAIWAVNPKANCDELLSEMDDCCEALQCLASNISRTADNENIRYLMIDNRTKVATRFRGDDAITPSAIPDSLLSDGGITGYTLKAKSARMEMYKAIKALDFVEAVDAPSRAAIITDRSCLYNGIPDSMIAMRFRMQQGGKALTKKRCTELTQLVRDICKSFTIKGDVMYSSFQEMTYPKQEGYCQGWIVTQLN